MNSSKKRDYDVLANDFMEKCLAYKDEQDDTPWMYVRIMLKKGKIPFEYPMKRYIPKDREEVRPQTVLLYDSKTEKFQVVYQTFYNEDVVMMVIEDKHELIEMIKLFIENDAYDAMGKRF